MSDYIFSYVFFTLMHREFNKSYYNSSIICWDVSDCNIFDSVVNITVTYLMFSLLFAIKNTTMTRLV